MFVNLFSWLHFNLKFWNFKCACERLKKALQKCFAFALLVVPYYLLLFLIPACRSPWWLSALSRKATTLQSWSTYPLWLPQCNFITAIWSLAFDSHITTAEIDIGAQRGVSLLGTLADSRNIYTSHSTAHSFQSTVLTHTSNNTMRAINVYIYDHVEGSRVQLVLILSPCTCSCVYFPLVTIHMIYSTGHTIRVATNSIPGDSDEQTCQWTGIWSQSQTFD